MTDPNENFVVVALPAEDDPVTKISSETHAHVTVLYLPMVALAAAKAFLGPLKDTLRVTSRGKLGEDEADVIFLDVNGPLSIARKVMLQDDVIRKAYDSIEQFPKWTPHLTLGYPEKPALNRDVPSYIRIDRLAIMINDDEIVTEAERTLTMQHKQPFPTPEQALAHYGVLGMKWGVRKDRKSKAPRKPMSDKTKRNLKIGGAVALTVGVAAAAVLLGRRGNLSVESLVKSAPKSVPKPVRRTGPRNTGNDFILNDPAIVALQKTHDSGKLFAERVVQKQGETSIEELNRRTQQLMRELEDKGSQMSRADRDILDSLR